MAPNLLGNSALFLAEPNSAESVQQDVSLQGKIPLKSTKPEHKIEIVWRNVLILTYLHIAALYGLYYTVTLAQWKTILWGYIVGIAGTALGVAGGAHRLWTHKAYKAKLPLRIFFALVQASAMQNSLYEWVRDHRVHHKFADTDADPHNATRGFFFSHVGWLLVRKHKDVFTKGKTIDMSDLEADPVVMFQKKYYLILAPLLCFVFPGIVPWYFWNESTAVCFYSVGIFRYIFFLHATWLINSAAHTWGMKPYDKNIKACDNTIVAILVCGEGWHNYHHVFPWDYKTAELGSYMFNFTLAFIDLMAKIGLAYDLKTVPVDMVTKRASRTGDGSRGCAGLDKEESDYADQQNIWGWGDKDMKEDDIQLAEIHHPKSH